MTNCGRTSHSVIAIVLAMAAITLFGANSSSAEAPPSSEEISRMLSEQPLSAETWPIWRDRDVAWFYDRTNKTKEFDEKLEEYVGKQATQDGAGLPPALAEDAVAWMLLGDYLAKQTTEDGGNLTLSETAYRK